MLAAPADRDRHTLTAYDDELRALRALIAEMGGLVEVALARALAALQHRNRAAADEVIAGDKAIDAMERRARRDGGGADRPPRADGRRPCARCSPPIASPD